jgi:phosphoserine aminotransferase
MTTHRIYNFSAGPATLPLPVLEEAQRDLVALPGVGMSVLEISHRSKPAEEIIQTAESNLRSLGRVPDGYKVLFLQGGASLQFSMVPMNLRRAGAVADYLVTGEWSKKALKEAKRSGAVHVAATTESVGFKRVPRQWDIAGSPGAAYMHMTSNNTIFGTQWPHVPETSGVPLVCDASSDIFSRPIEVSKFGLIYAGAQKNLGPAGVTIAIIRDDLLTRSSDSLPAMLNYRTHAESGSLYNTPPVFAIYVLGLVLKWLAGLGGLTAVEALNQRKARRLYDELDRTPFWRPHAERDSRSTMNVTFRLPSEELEKLFVKEATEAGLDGLKGHRSVGGLRASIYTAFPEAGVDALVQFMQEFVRTHG